MPTAATLLARIRGDTRYQELQDLPPLQAPRLDREQLRIIQAEITKANEAADNLLHRLDGRATSGLLLNDILANSVAAIQNQYLSFSAYEYHPKLKKAVNDLGTKAIELKRKADAASPARALQDLERLATAANTATTAARTQIELGAIVVTRHLKSAQEAIGIAESALKEKAHKIKAINSTRAPITALEEIERQVTANKRYVLEQLQKKNLVSSTEIRELSMLKEEQSLESSDLTSTAKDKDWIDRIIDAFNAMVESLVNFINRWLNSEKKSNTAI